jgi:formylglycine-generating enzyme required for sulfatase activity
MWPEWEQSGFDMERVDFVGLDCPGYRLPTEAEWEYAARAGRTLDEVAAQVDDQAWYGVQGSKPVATKSANPWGVFDMLGNVWEECWDFQAELSAGPATDPLGPPHGRARVTKGGSYMDDQRKELTASRRIEGGPEGRDANVGFRIARTAR